MRIRERPQPWFCGVEGLRVWSGEAERLWRTINWAPIKQITRVIKRWNNRGKKKKKEKKINWEGSDFYDLFCDLRTDRRFTRRRISAWRSSGRDAGPVFCRSSFLSKLHSSSAASHCSSFFAPPPSVPDNDRYDRHKRWELLLPGKSMSSFCVSSRNPSTIRGISKRASIPGFFFFLPWILNLLLWCCRQRSHFFDPLPIYFSLLWFDTLVHFT